MTTTSNRRISLKGAYYDIEGVGVYRRVTSWLDAAIPKPGLVGWAKNLTAENARATLAQWGRESPDGRVLLDEAHLDRLVQAAKAQPQAIKEEAADLGTLCHQAIHNHLAGRSGLIPKETEWAVLNFDSWWQERGFHLVASELTVWSTALQYAGTMDILGRGQGGKLYVVDIKTGKALYPEMFLQVAAYAGAWEEMGTEPKHEIEGTILVRVGKEGEQLQVLERSAAQWGLDYATFTKVIPLALWLEANKIERHGKEKKA